MPFITIKGLRPSFTDDTIIRREISKTVASVQKLHLEQKDTEIVYSAGGPTAGNPFMDKFVLIEIILSEKPERTKEVLDMLCEKVRDAIMDIYSKSFYIRFSVIAIPRNETHVGLSQEGMWTKVDSE